MNYYTAPNYMNYSYNQYPYLQQQQQMPQQFNMQGQQQQQNITATTATPFLNGKIVDGEDVVKATEVPIGGYGIFPKADLSEIYLKSWNNNGTTNIIKFKPVIEQAPADAAIDNFMQLMQKIDDIDNKLDNFISQPQQSPPIKKTQQKSEVVKKNGF